MSAGSLKWRYQTSGGLWCSPTIGADGTIYVGTDDYYLFAITSSGNTILTHTTLSADIVILYASGSLKWTYQTNGAVRSSPAIGSDGTIYVGSYDSYLYAFTSSGNMMPSHTTTCADIVILYVSGSVKWSYHTGGGIHSSPALGSDGTIYVGSGDYNLYAFTSSGNVMMLHHTAFNVCADIVILYIVICDQEY
jgi:outer membrane protein assembly factor BamB